MKKRLVFFAVIAVAMIIVIAGCKGASPTAPSAAAQGPWQQATLVDGKPATIKVSVGDDWSNGMMAGGEVIVSINRYSCGTGKIGTEWRVEWSAATSFPMVTVFVRTFSTRPEPWDGNRNIFQIAGEVSPNFPDFAIAGEYSTVERPTTNMRPMLIRAPGKIEWVRFAFAPYVVPSRMQVADVADLRISCVFTN